MELAGGRARRSGPGVVVGGIDQARGAARADDDAAAARSAGCCPTGPTPTSAPCWPSSGCAPTTSARPAATLSPGERTRAALALLQARGVNLLVLDEPTNHLDLPAIEQLEQALATYPGTLLLVTPRPPAARRRPRSPGRLAVDGGAVREL